MWLTVTLDACHIKRLYYLNRWHHTLVLLLWPADSVLLINKGIYFEVYHAIQVSIHYWYVHSQSEIAHALWIYTYIVINRYVCGDTYY